MFPRALFSDRPGVAIGLLTTAVGILCLLLQPGLPWLGTWPEALTLPLSDWVGSGLAWLLGLLKPAARLFSSLLEYPMGWSNWLFGQTPWPIVIALVTAFGWWVGGLSMALLGVVGLGLVLSSGYWAESMNTLALVAVSVPLATLLGAAIGIAAYDLPRIRAPIQTALDVMQTVPTFAYLTPLLVLFGFGPVVGLIASVIYAAPPMARNVLLGLQRVEEEIKEAALMSGANRLQQLFLIELPAAKTQILVGLNQCLMASLSMVIIAAVIGGFDDIGWEVLLTMRKALFGQSLLAGLVIVAFAVIIDRMSAKMATERHRYDRRVAMAIIAAGLALALLFGFGGLADPSGLPLLDPLADRVDAALSAFTVRNGAALDQLKNGAMFYALLPIRIGLDDAVLPFTWGFQWTNAMSIAWLAASALMAGLLWASGRSTAGAALLALSILPLVGVAHLPWPFVLVGVTGLAWLSGGRRLSLFVAAMIGLLMLSGLWERALLSLYLVGVSVLACAFVGGAIGLASAVSPMLWRLVRPVCDMLQTIPLFVFLIPALMFFQIGEFSAFLAICAYAIVPMIRYTQHGLTNTPEELLEAAVTSGATPLQTLIEVRAPYATPTILLGLNQTILYAFSMLVIAALIGTTGLGQSIYLALGRADLGLGITAGIAMAILALVADRIVQGFADGRRKALGL
ncbi:MAG: ABC transporter permease subunit [Paracoccaceae bacterium]